MKEIAQKIGKDKSTVTPLVNQLTALDVQYRKSAIVIIGLLVIVSPIIIQQLLMIMFRIPTIYA